MDEEIGTIHESGTHTIQTKGVPIKSMIKKLSLIVAFVFLSASAYSEDAKKDQILELNDFTGGLVTKVSDLGLSTKQATVAENVRFNKKYRSISKRDNLNTYGTADATEPILGMHRFYKKNGDKVLLVNHGDEIEKGSDSAGTFTNILTTSSGDHRWQWVTWHDIAIGTDGYNQPVKYDGSSASATYLGSLLATDAGSGSGPASGTYSYKVGCYSTTYTVLLNTPSNEITANGNDVALSMIPICNDTTLNGEATIGRKIYRTTSSTSSYKLLSNGTIADNTTVTLTDSDADAALGAAMPAGDATWTPPKGKFILVQNDRLFLANDPSSSPSRVNYSSIGSHDIFDTSNETGYLDIRQNDGDSITFIKGVLGLLTVGKNNTIQKIYIDGADPDADWSISDPLSYIGCQAPYSVANTPLGIVYLGKHGLYRFNGQYSELISESVTQVIEDIQPSNLANAWGVFHDDQLYHLAYTSEESGEAFNNRVLVLDFLAKAYSIDTLNINAFANFNSGNDWGILYAGASNSGAVYAYSSETNEIVHKRHSDFNGLWDDMRYIPTAVGGDADSPVLEISRTETINELAATINSVRGVIDRQDYIGRYVSQPLNVGASLFDKLYWNESFPTTSSDATFQLRTSATGQKNLLHNDSFEWWDNGPYQPTSVEEPNDWSFSMTTGTGGSATASTTETHLGTYSARLTKPNTGDTVITRNISAVPYRGLSMAFDGWIKSANSVHQKVYFEVYDGVTRRKYHYDNGAGWQQAATSLTVSATANTISTKCVIGSEANAVAYFDQVMLVQGTTATNDWTTWSAAQTNPSGSDVSGITAGQYVQYLITLTTDDLTQTPTITNQGTYNVRLLYSKEGAPQSSSIPLRYSTGWMDLGSSSYPKIVRGIETYHTGTEGSIAIELETYDGESDSWTIDLISNPDHYKEYTEGGALRGKLFKLNITADGDTPVTIDKVNIIFDVEPSQGIE